MSRLGGAYTALITPTVGRGKIDWDAYDRLLDFQQSARVDGVVIAGTTGESPTLETDELLRLVSRARDRLPSSVEVIPGTGRNHLAGTLELTQFAADLGLSTVMLVDPYYNAPSSLEIRREYIGPVAQRFPGLGILPYVIPGRTGTRLEPRDVAGLLSEGQRIAGVKDATGDDAYASELRRRCPELSILCGDDARTLSMMADPAIRADGVISVVSNLAPHAVVDFVRSAREGEWPKARESASELQALFDIVTIRVVERADGDGELSVRSRNPVPVKSAMALLGAPVGACRPPLGRLTPRGLDALHAALATTHRLSPEVLGPFSDWFGADISERLSNRALWPELSYGQV